MKKNFFYLELLISMWYLKEMNFSKENSLFFMLLTLLLYLSIKVTFYIFKEKKVSRYILMFSLCYLTLTGYFIFPPILYFITLNLIQLIFKISRNYLIFSLIFILYIKILPIMYIEIYLLLSIISFMVLLMENSFKEKSNIAYKSSQDLKKKLELKNEIDFNVKQYELALNFTSRLEERNSIAQKLHDELGHTLSGNTLQLEALVLMMDKDIDKSKDMANRVIANLRDGSESIRKILKNIKPETASMNIQSIKSLILETTEKSSILIDLIYDGDIADLDYIKWHVIIKNVKEAFTNMMKYSNATKANLKFERLNKVFKITISDNGVGSNKIIYGMGLDGMEERIDKIGGTLIIDGLNGFNIIMLIPIGV